MMERLVHQEPLAEIKRKTQETDSRHSDPEEGKSLVPAKSEPRADEPAKNNDNFEITIWKNKKISFNKSIIFMRIALFLWFGAARLPSLFLSVFMKSRGLTLIEYSSAFSFIFLFQFSAGSVSGLIADKSGSGKPLLLFHVLGTVLVLFGMLLTPKVSSETCEMQKNYNCSSILEGSMNSSACSFNCLHQGSRNNYDTRTREGNLTNLTFLEYSARFTDFDNGTLSDDFIEHGDTNFCNETCLSLCESPSGHECVKSRNKLVVLLYVVWIFAIYSVRSTAYRFMDFTALCLIPKSDSHFGRERFFAVCGEIFISIVITFILNIDKSQKSKYNYDSVFWFADALLLCSFMLVCTLKVPMLPPGRNFLRKVSVFSKDANFWAFAFIVYLAGNGFCICINFHFLLLQKMKAPKILFGLMAIAFGFYGIPGLLTSRWWIMKFGTYKIFVFSLLCYSANLAAYSFLYNPWLALLIEITNAFTFHLFWVAVVLHCESTAPQGFVATMTAVAGTLHFGIGRSSGVFLEGMLISTVGQRAAYRVTSSFFLLMAILYSIFFCMRGKFSRTVDTVNGKEDSDMKRTKIEKNKLHP